MTNKLLSVQQLSEWMSVPVSTIYKWTHEGFIPHVKLGRLVRFKQEDVERWVEKRAVAGRLKRRVELV